MHASQLSKSFREYELRQHKLPHTKPFNCFRLSFSTDGTQNTLKVADLHLTHTHMMPTVDDICGRPVHRQDFPSSQQRVVGGAPCQRGACPWQAALIYDDADSFCGGSVISQWHILTASHCFKHRNMSKIRVLLGKTDLQVGEDTVQTHHIAAVFTHSKFNNLTLQNDFAIIRTKRTIEFNAFVIPVCLPKKESGDRSKTDRDAYVSGWGIKKNSVSSSNSLHVGTVLLISTEECNERWTDYKGRYPEIRVTGIVDHTTVCAIGDRG